MNENEGLTKSVTQCFVFNFIVCVFCITFLGYLPFFPRHSYINHEGIVFQVMQKDGYFRVYTFDTNEKNLYFKPAPSSQWRKSCMDAESDLSRIVMSSASLYQQ